VKKRTEIVIEIEEITLVSCRPVSTQAWCSACGDRVMMVTPEQAAAIAQVSLREINVWVEAAAVHFIETPNRLLLVCVNSLPPPTQTRESSPPSRITG